MNEFCANYEEKSNAVRKQGWDKLKKNYNMTTKGDDGLTMEEFRAEAICHVSKLCLTVMKKLGFTSPGRHIASGTSGWKSDIDTVFFAPNDMPETVQIMEKLLFDAIFLEKFKGLPGQLFDIESYLNHAGSAFDTGFRMKTDKGKERFSRLEFTASSLQMLRQTGGPESKDWIAYRTQLLDSAVTEDLRQAMKEIFADIEEFQKDVQNGIQKQIVKESGNVNEGVEETMSEEKLNKCCEQILKENPISEKLATMSYKTKRLIKVSEKMDECKAEISKLDSEIRSLGVAQK